LVALNPKVTKEIVGAGRVHGTHMFGNISGIEERIAGYLKEHVGAASSGPVVSPYGGKVYFASEEAARAVAGKAGSELRWYSSAEEAEVRGLTATEGASEQGD
jgi:hypothetical protein